MKAGTRIADRYEVRGLIGQGGTARVFSAHDHVLRVDRAIKVLRSSGTADSRHRRRLHAEARAMAALAHPNVLAVHDMGSHDGHDYIVMSLAERSLLDACWSSPQPIHVALAWTIQVLSALAVAHDAGIVHRDVKPENVLLDNQGNVLLADFGIALLKQGERHTMTGAAMGSLSFMAPEQRLDARSVGPSADLYSTGCMLFNLLTGANPFDLFTATASSKRLQKVLPEVRYPILKATRYEPSQRFTDARAMASALVAVLEDLEQDAMTTSMDRDEAITYVDTQPALSRLGPEFEQVEDSFDAPLVAAAPAATAAAIPPLHPHEAERMSALLDLALLDTPIEERFERHTRMAQHLFRVPIAVVSLVDTDRQWFKSHRGLDASQTGRDESFCGHAILEPERLTVVPDATKDPRFQQNPLVLGGPGIRFYASCPLRSDTGMPVGTLCVIDSEPRDMAPSEQSLLHDLAKMVEAELRSAERASTDDATGLSNLEGFKRSANRVMTFAKAEGRAITMVRVQLQRLQSRATQDNALAGTPLKAFTELLQAAFDGAVVLARVDQDGFAILLPDTPDVIAMGKDLRRRIQDAGDLQVEMRLGSAVYDPNKPQSLAGVMGRADPDPLREEA